jgi:hypothetical protein
MSANRKWSKKGFEVHVSKDGLESNWYRYAGTESSAKRPMFEQNQLALAKKTLAKAAKENKFSRLVKLEMNYELLDWSLTAETKQEAKDKVLAAAKELFKDDPTIHVYECSFMSMTTLNMSESQIRIQVLKEKLGEPCPVRKDFPKGLEGKPLHAAACHEWEDKIRPMHETKVAEIHAKLKAAGIRYTSGKDYGWTVFRLA